MVDHRKQIQRWASQSATSARSVLVTIFGDTILPITNVVWLSQLFELTDVFGFNQRLIRTSVARLVSEGWLENERVGRVSRYHLTALAVEESTQAEDQIYSQATDDWDGQWVLAFVGNPKIEPGAAAVLQRHLQWRGFSQIADGILASPTATIDSTRELCRLVSADEPIPLAQARFDDVEQLASTGFFRSGFALDEQEEAYANFIDDYGSLTLDPERLESVDAFGLRTMVVHDFRRIRLRGAVVPVQLLPSPWIGDEAFELAADLYSTTSASASAFLQQILEISYPDAVKGRFYLTSESRPKRRILS